MTRPLFTIGAATLLILLVASSPAAAQVRGVRGGVNFSTIVVSPHDLLGDEPGGGIGAIGGAFITLKKGDGWNIEVAGQLSMRRLTFGPHIDDTVTYLEVPGVFTFGVMRRGDRRVRVLGGGSFAYVVAARESVAGQSYTVKHAYRSVELGAVAGAQADVTPRWSVDVRYLIGLTNPYPEDVSGGTARQRSLEATVGYRFK